MKENTGVEKSRTDLVGLLDKTCQRSGWGHAAGSLGH